MAEERKSRHRPEASLHGSQSREVRKHQAYAYADSLGYAAIHSHTSAAAVLDALPHVEQVRAAWLCACSVLYLYEHDGDSTAPREALLLVERWLSGERVSRREMLTAAAAADAASHASSYAAYAAAAVAAAYAVVERIIHAVTREHRARRWTADLLWRSSRLGLRLDRSAPDLDDQAAVALDVLEERGQVELAVDP